MRVVLSVDMEGVSQLESPFAISASRPEYWQTGKAAVEADTVAAAEGLLSAGASEVIVLDNHASGNPQNVSARCLPVGARLETWSLFDVPLHDVGGMFQVGYHARGGTDGYISHTYVPGLRFRVNGELISESHGRAWAGSVPLIGIAGNDTHRATVGSLADAPYLVVQRTLSRGLAERVFADPQEGWSAIREFAAGCLRNVAAVPPAELPGDILFEASMPNGVEQEQPMVAAGWRRVGDVEYAAELAAWSDARELLTVAMNAAAATLLPYWVTATSAAEAARVDPTKADALSQALFVEWCATSFPAWYSLPAVEVRPPDVVNT
jgi:D-aminopeptidase